MGFMSELGIDPNEIEAPSYGEDPEPGWYRFEISEATIVNGTSSDEDVVKFRITYDCYNDDDTPAGQKSEWWTLFEVAGEEPGEDALRSRGFLKKRLLDLGLSADPDPSEIEGLTGTIQLIRKGDYINVRKVTVDEPKPKAAPARTAPAKKAAPGAKPNPFKKG